MFNDLRITRRGVEFQPPVVDDFTDKKEDMLDNLLQYRSREGRGIYNLSHSKSILDGNPNKIELWKNRHEHLNSAVKSD